MGSPRKAILAIGVVVLVCAVAGAMALFPLAREEEIPYEVHTGCYGERTYVWIEEGPDGTELRRAFPRPPNCARTAYEDRAEAERLFAGGEGKLVGVGRVQEAKRYRYLVTVSTDVDVLLPVSEPASDADAKAFDAVEAAALRGEGKLVFANERGRAYGYRVDLPDGRSVIYTSSRPVGG